MNAGDLWKKFGKELRAQIDADARLQNLSREVLDGLSERLLLLTPLVYHLITQWFARMPTNERAFWYDDPELARRYSGAQAAVVPVRIDIAEYMAMAVWATVEQVLEHQFLAYVLDLGTGDGVMARALLARRPQYIPRERMIVVASDRSEAMLNTHAAVFAGQGILTMDAKHGDMRGPSWHELDTYRERLGTSFQGFDAVMGMMCFHILPDRGSHLYPGIASILRPHGRLVFTHDFFHLGDTWATFAPTNTLIDGYRAYAKVTQHPISFASYLAGFILRRCFLQGDRLCTLAEEVEAVNRTFTQVQTAKHARYREFAIIVADQQASTSLPMHPSFDSSSED